jgi:hypothetical protein
MSENEFTREQDRPSGSKAFNVAASDLKGSSTIKMYNKYPQYESVQRLQRQCYRFAASYASTMITRLLTEEPDFFDGKDMDRV